MSWGKRLLWILVILAVIGGGVGGFLFLRHNRGDPGGSNPGTGLFAAKRGDLTISVTESGDVKALDTYDIKSEVEGRSTIISIVDEGTYITPEDVNNGKILVELDSSEIKQKLTQQQITFLSAEAAYTDANESLEIQKKQNDSDIKAGQMKVRFALMDLQKYLGAVVADKFISAATNEGLEPNEIAQLVYDPKLGGQALQQLRELDGDIKLKEAELELAKSRLGWTEKLYEKQYVSLNEKEADSLDKERKDIAREKADTAEDLFIKYEFPKEAEKLLSDYEESKRELERIEARARSKLTQAQAKLGSARATYTLEKDRLDKWGKQLEACVMRASTTGQVVYSSSMMDRWERQRMLIEVGASVQERQKIISIPDPCGMKVEVKIHETWIDKVQPGQSAKVVISAFPDDEYTGKVLRKAPLADPEDFLNPDLKVYTTDVSVEEATTSIKTGMTAKVEIIIDELHDVLNVPIQSVVNHEGQKLCYVSTDNGPKKREVETGLFNDNFVEIKTGLTEGENVLLNPPRITEASSPGRKPAPSDQARAPRTTSPGKG